LIERGQSNLSQEHVQALRGNEENHP
jgi:hypothetical protein